MSSFLDDIKALAPTIIGALAGPYAPLAVPFVAHILGQDKAAATVQGVTDALANTQMSGDQVLQLRQAEVDFKKHLSDNKIALAEISGKDTADARDMQKTVKSFVPPVLAVLITVGFFGILGYMMSPYYAANVATDQPVLVMLGSLGAAWIQVMHFYFGSSTGSQGKDDTISNLSK